MRSRTSLGRHGAYSGQSASHITSDGGFAEASHHAVETARYL